MGLASNCLGKIKEQVNSLLDQKKAIIVAISSHLNDISESEEKLKNGFRNGIDSNKKRRKIPKSNDQPVDSKEINDVKKEKVDGFKRILEELTNEEKDAGWQAKYGKGNTKA